VKAKFHYGVVVAAGGMFTKRIEAVLEDGDSVLDVAEAVHQVKQRLVGARVSGQPFSSWSHGVMVLRASRGWVPPSWPA